MCQTHHVVSAKQAGVRALDLDRIAIVYGSSRLPEGVRPLTHRLKDAGYLTGSIKKMGDQVVGSGKLDLNFVNEGKIFESTNWDEIKKGKPFFLQVNTPEALVDPLADLGLRAASRGYPAGKPFADSGTKLIAAMQSSLGEKDFAADVAAAWTGAYAAASACMQARYSPSERKAAELAEADAAAPAC